MPDKFTDEEWDYIQDAPFHIGIAVSDFDLNPDSSKKETDAIIKICADAEKRYRGNRLISEVVSNINFFADMNNDNMVNIEKYCGEISSILKKKNLGGEALEYKAFLYEIAEGVAKAYGEGFLGLGNKVSQKEALILEKIKLALDI